MRRLTKRPRLGDIVKSPFLSSYELIVYVDYKVGPTYRTMYISGSADGCLSHVPLTMSNMRELDYKLIYNVFDKRNKHEHRIQCEED